MEDQEKKLCVVEFEPQLRETEWGRESYQIADLGFADTVAKGGWLDGNSLSDIMETYLERIVGDKVYYFYGRQFPVSVRIFETRSNTPVYLCPDDEIAAQRYDSLGKKKLWYIVSAKPGAKLYVGFKQEVTAGGLYSAWTENNLDLFLNAIVPSKGESIVIDPSVVHCAGAGLTVLEIAEASALDFNIWNWGGENDCDDLVEVLDYIDMREYRPRGAVPQESGGAETKLLRKIASEQEFTVTEIALEGTLQIKTETFDSFLVYTCVSGEASLQLPALREDGTKYTENIVLSPGRSVLVPDEIEEFYLAARAVGTVLLETMVQREAAQDYQFEENVVEE